MPVPSSAEWLTGNDARRLTGLNHYTLMRKAALGEIRSKADRGDALKYSREDVERLADGRQASAASPTAV